MNFEQIRERMFTVEFLDIYAYAMSIADIWILWVQIGSANLKFDHKIHAVLQ